MEERVPCKILEPIKVGGVVLPPSDAPVDLPRQVAEQQQAVGRVRILEAFTPVEPDAGVVEIAQRTSRARKSGKGKGR